MGDEEVRLKRSQQRKRNYYAKVLREQIFQQKIAVDKTKYKREKVSIKDLDKLLTEEEYENEHKTTREDFD